MALNREQQSILFAAENGTLENVAAEKARRNEAGWQQDWTIEQHLEYLQKKAAELKAEVAKEAAKTTQSQFRRHTSHTSRPLMNYTQQVLAGIDTGE